MRGLIDVVRLDLVLLWMGVEAQGGGGGRIFPLMAFLSRPCSTIAEYSPIFPEISYLENRKKLENKNKIRPPAPIFLMIQDAKLKIFLRGLKFSKIVNHEVLYMCL